MSSIIIFIVILAVLILVHELGHFFAAKLFGIRVDEFGFGYPPRALTLFIWKGTRFSLNWLPFGGFVKIFGETGEQAQEGAPEAGKSFVDKSRPVQAFVLAAGVISNIIFAWILISLGFTLGLPTSTSTDIGEVKNAHLIVTSVAPHSPAEAAGLKAGDTITQFQSGKQVLQSPTPEAASDFISTHKELNISYQRGNEMSKIDIKPASGIIQDKLAIGISMDMIGTLYLPVHKAFIQGAITTYSLTKLTAVGLVTFVVNTFRGVADLSQVTGPVGIVGLVGDASQLGYIYLLSFTAFISINLAVINLVPFPALDGGRLLFVIIESVKRTAISPKIANIVNMVGFALLIFLMVLVTIHDIVKLI